MKRSYMQRKETHKGFRNPSPSNRKDIEGEPAREARKPKGKGLKARRPSRAKTVDGDSAQDIKDECDWLIRDILKVRDRQCFTCPETEGLQVGHLFHRGLQAVRWNLENNNAQCPDCNSRHEYEPEHYVEAFVQRFGELAYSELRRIAHRSGKFSYIQLLSIRDGLRRELEARKASYETNPKICL